MIPGPAGVIGASITKRDSADATGKVVTGICEAGNGLRFARLMKNRLSGYGGVEESHDPIRIVTPLGPKRPIVILPGEAMLMTLGPGAGTAGPPEHWITRSPTSSVMPSARSIRGLVSEGAQTKPTNLTCTGDDRGETRTQATTVRMAVPGGSLRRIGDTSSRKFGTRKPGRP